MSNSITMKVWRYYANMAGVTLVAFVLSAALVWMFASDDPVISVSDVRWDHEPAGDNRPKKVKVGSRYVFYYTMERYETCRGDVVTVYTSKAELAPAVITTRRPHTLLSVARYPGIMVENELPPSVTPGNWSMQVSLISRCPTRERADLIAKFDLEVT